MRKKLGSRALRSAKTGSERKGPAGGGSERPGGETRKALAPARREKSPVARSAAAWRPATTLGDSARRLLVAPLTPRTPSLQFVGKRPAWPGPDPTEKRAAPPFARHSGASPPSWVPAIWGPPLRSPRRASPPAQDLPQQPHRFHSRGAPVAEFVGDGLDAPGPSHRDVAALRAYVQSHHRHGRLAVLLRPGLGPSPPPPLSAPAARGAAGSDRSCVTRAPRLPGDSSGLQTSHPGAGGAESPRVAPQLR